MPQDPSTRTPTQQIFFRLTVPLCHCRLSITASAPAEDGVINEELPQAVQEAGAPLTTHSLQQDDEVLADSVTFCANKPHQSDAISIFIPFIHCI